MRAVIGTTTGFHLRRLAVELSVLAVEVEYFSYTPRFRMRQEGIDRAWSHSMFAQLLPTSALAAVRGAPWQANAVEKMLNRTDDFLARMVPPADVFIGLSSMAVRSAARARELGATVVIERGSRHVLSQDRLLKDTGGSGLTQRYIERELASYEEADFIVVPSSHAAVSFLDEGFDREQIVVCPLGVDLHRFAPTARPGGPLRLLFVGGWTHQKGVDVLAAAVERRPDWQLTHVGVHIGDSFPRNHGRIRSLGYRDHRRLAEVMSQHHVLVLPSRQDGFGMVLLEALAAGLPVVASDMTGGPDIRDSLEDPTAVEIVVPDDVEALVRGIEVAATRELSTATLGPRRRLSDRDRDYYSWEGYGRRYLAFLKRVLNPGGGR